MAYSTDPDIPSAAEENEYNFFENPLMWLFDGVFDFFSNIFDNFFDTAVNLGVVEESDPADSDGDGVIDYYEDADEDDTDADDAFSYKDQDNDYVPDYVEFVDETSYFNGADYVDSDLDGISDYVEERFLDSDPNKLDSDGDGVTDIEEYSEDTDPNDATSFKDENEDGVSDTLELYQNYYAETLATDYAVEGDTDGDGVSDAVEEAQGTDINDKYSFLDSDNDGIPDDVETNQLGSDAHNIDSDGDGVIDIYELFHEKNDYTSDINDAKSFKDTDSDGKSDFYEDQLQGYYPGVAADAFNTAKEEAEDKAAEDEDEDVVNVIEVGAMAASKTASYDVDDSQESLVRIGENSYEGSAEEDSFSPKIWAVLNSMENGPNILKVEVDVEDDEDAADEAGHLDFFL